MQVIPFYSKKKWALQTQVQIWTAIMKSVKFNMPKNPQKKSSKIQYLLGLLNLNHVHKTSRVEHVGTDLAILKARRFVGRFLVPG